MPIRAEDLDEAEALMQSADYAAAAAAVDRAWLAGGAPQLSELPPLSRAALIKGKALLSPLVEQLTDEARDDPLPAQFRPAYELFQLAARLDDDNEEALLRLENMQGLVGGFGGEQKREVKPGSPTHPEPLDVVVVGAGASGVGLGILLTKVFGLDSERVLLVERGAGVGESFRRWPKEMRFISPSFNQQGWTNSFDLNSVVYETSPAFTVFSEHPSGEQYADYLHHIATANELTVRSNTEVKAVRPFGEGDGFEVDVAPSSSKDDTDPALCETLRCRYVVWAAGEFQYPRASTGAFPGSELCLHNSSIRSWAELPGDDFVVIGGYESGMDASCNLSQNGKRCTVLSSTAYWNVVTDDPSTELAPYTAQRVRAACASPTPPRLLAPLRVHAVEMEADGTYTVRARKVAPSADDGAKSSEDKPRLGLLGEHRVPLQVDAEDADALPASDTGEVTFHTPQPPVLCSGFEGSVRLGVAKDLFQWGRHDAAAAEGGDGDGDTDTDSEDDVDVDGRGQSGNSAKRSKTRAEDPFVVAPKKMHAAEEDGGAMTGVDEVVVVEDGTEGKDAASACEENSPLLNEYDESTKTPGLFLVGPMVRHKDLSFCFVYKFRQRFGVVADCIARGLGYYTKDAVAECREMEMFLDDFECCKGACGETC